MTNTRRESLLFTALAGEQIDRAMEACASQRKVLVLDCCYSGAFPAGRVAKGDTEVHALERFQGKGRTVLTASDATQYSFEGDQLLVGDAVQDDSRSVSTAAADRLALLREGPAGRQTATRTPAQRPKSPASLAPESSPESPPAEEKPEAAQPAFTWPEPAQSPSHPSQSKPGRVKPGESEPGESLSGETSFGLVLADVDILFVLLAGVLTIVLAVVAWVRS
jgi:hypothetical protein